MRTLSPHPLFAARNHQYSLQLHHWRLSGAHCRSNAAAFARRLAPAAALTFWAPTKKAGMTLEEFQQMLEDSPTPVMVDFYTHWCGPCKIVSKAIKVLEPAMLGSVRFEQVDTEVHPLVADRYGVRKLPTLLLFRGGQPVGGSRVEGVMSAQDLQVHLLKLLK